MLLVSLSKSPALIMMMAVDAHCHEAKLESEVIVPLGTKIVVVVVKAIVEEIIITLERFLKMMLRHRNESAARNGKVTGIILDRDRVLPRTEEEKEVREKMIVVDAAAVNIERIEIILLDEIRIDVRTNITMTMILIVVMVDMIVEIRTDSSNRFNKTMIIGWVEIIHLVCYTVVAVVLLLHIRT